METKTYSYSEWFSCGKKRPYATVKALEKAAKALLKKNGYAGEVHGYHCKICGNFHLTSKYHSPGEIEKSEDLVF